MELLKQLSAINPLYERSAVQEIEPGRKYLLITARQLSSESEELIASTMAAAGVDITVLSGLDPTQVAIYDLEKSASAEPRRLTHDGLTG